MSYLDDLPHCPDCGHTLRVKDGVGWCADCQRQVIA